MISKENFFPPPISPSDVRPLDVVLIRGTGPVSEYVAFLNDSFYSHVAIMVSKTKLLEASLSGVREFRINQHLKLPTCLFIDIYRFAATEKLSERVLSATGRKLLTANAPKAFPFKRLAWTGFMSALRNYVPLNRGGRARLRGLLDQLLPTNNSKLHCLDVFAAAALGELAANNEFKVLARRPRLWKGLPSHDLSDLVRETTSIKRYLANRTESSANFTMEAPSDLRVLRRLDLARAERREDLIASEGKVWTGGGGALMLSDIETSPSLRLVGRLKAID